MNQEPETRNSSERQPQDAQIKAEPIPTSHLFQKGSNERIILHRDIEYRLRITAQGKLILTK